ncbi:TolB family protein [Candidatus Leptofilum sp.]|uniref:TolB family protein n=1 Tax=Candidatus Leptofilum sp. TaxID=3241576 RepID=UPI003B5C1E90
MALSSDGRFAAYYSFDGQITPDDPDLCTDGDWAEPCEDLFIYDRQTGQIERIPVGRSSGLGKSYTISLSADGRFIAFTSLGTSLTSNELSQCDDYRGFSRTCYTIYLHDRQTGETCLVVNSNGDSIQPALSADGRYLTFASLAQNLLPNAPTCDTPTLTVCGQIYLLDTQTSELQLISQTTSGEWGNGGSGHPRISADGRIITFASDASNLVPNDTNAVSDIFRYDTTTGEMMRVSFVER